MGEPIPCIDCLILGVCRHKPVIRCSLLYKFFVMKEKQSSEYLEIREILNIRRGPLMNGIRKIVLEENEREYIWL